MPRVALTQLKTRRRYLSPTAKPLPRPASQDRRHPPCEDRSPPRRRNRPNSQGHANLSPLQEPKMVRWDARKPANGPQRKPPSVVRFVESIHAILESLL